MTSATRSAAGRQSPQPFADAVQQPPRAVPQAQQAAAAAAAPAAVVPQPQAIYLHYNFPPLSECATLAVSSFLASDGVKEFADQCAAEFTNLRAQYEKATASLAKLEASCKQRSSAAGAAIVQLPKSLQLNIVKSARFTPVADEPNFYRNIQQELQKVEDSATTEVARIIQKSKTLHVQHLLAKCNASAFSAARTTIFHETHTLKYAEKYNKEAAEKDEQFPIDFCSGTFHKNLLKSVNDIFTKAVNAQIKKDKEQEERKIADLVAQEQVVAGAHTGTTINLIAEKKARQVVKEAAKATAFPAAASATTPNSVVAPPSKKKERGQGQRAPVQPPQTAAKPFSHKPNKSPRDQQGAEHHGNKRARDTRPRSRSRSASPRHRPFKRPYTEHSTGHHQDYRRRDVPSSAGTSSSTAANSRHKFFHEPVKSSSTTATTARRDEYSRADSKNVQRGDRRQSLPQQPRPISSTSHHDRRASPSRDKYPSTNARSDSGRSGREREHRRHH